MVCFGLYVMKLRLSKIENASLISEEKLNQNKVTMIIYSYRKK